MKKPKVAMLAMFRGGIGHYIAELSLRISDSFDLEFISYKYGLPGDEVTLDDPAISENLPKSPRFIISYNKYTETIESLGKTIDFLKQSNIDVLNVHVGTIVRETAYFVISLVTVAKKMGIKIIYTFHDVEPFEDYKGGKELLKSLYLLADLATVGGEDELNKLINNYDFPKEKLSIAKHGVYSIFDFNKYDQESARKHLGIPSGKKVLLNFGIYRPYKGFDETIKAMPSILEKHEDAFLYISTGLRLFKDVSDLSRLVEELNLKEKSKLVFDFVNSDEIEAIFKASDIVILPYKQVSQSGILNLALYFKKPVIISNLFLEAEVINNRMGYTVEPGNPNEIAEKANILLGDKDIYKKFQEEMANYTADDTWKQNADNFKANVLSLYTQKEGE